MEMAGTEHAHQSAQPNPMKTPGASKASEAWTTENEPHGSIDDAQPLASIEGKLETGFRDVATLLKQLMGLVEGLPEKSPAQLAHSQTKGGHKPDNTQVSTALARAQTMPLQCTTPSAVVMTTQEKYEDLIKENKNLQAMSDDLVKQLSETSSKLASATAAVTTARKKYEDPVKENKDPQTQSDHLAKKLSETSRRLTLAALAVKTTQDRYEDLMKENESLKEHSDHLADQLYEKSSKLASDTSAVTEMQKKYDDLVNQKMNLQAKSDNLAEQLSETKIKLASATAGTGRLHGIVFGMLKEQEQSDMEIIEAFGSLRQIIQAISRSKEIDPCSLYKLGTPKDKLLWAKLTPGELKNRTRGQIFDLLQRYILDYPCFGLEGFVVGGDAPEKAELGRADFERCFTDFERVLKELRVSNTAISEWRIATLYCVDQLRNQEQTSFRIANLISEHLRPIRTDAKSRDTQLDQNIFELCKQAFKLRIKMMKSKESYRCEIPRIGKFADQEQIAEAEHSEGQTGSDWNIAYTIFGALIKESEAAGRIVLEKARVTVH